MHHKNQACKHPRVFLPSVIKINGFKERASSLATGGSGRILVTMAIPHSQPSSETSQSRCYDADSTSYAPQTQATYSIFKQFEH